MAFSAERNGARRLSRSASRPIPFRQICREAATNFKLHERAAGGRSRRLANYSAVANLTFTEITETSTQHATLRYAESDCRSTAWAYYPSTSEPGGDAWFNNSSNYYDNPVKGNYAYQTMLHETGHALGLKHPHEAKGRSAPCRSTTIRSNTP